MNESEDFEIDRGDLELTRRDFLIASSAAAAMAALPRAMRPAGVDAGGPHTHEVGSP